MSVEESWRQILAWCGEHVPRLLSYIRPPADIEAVRTAEAVTGTTWPEDLRNLYLLSDGTERTGGVFLLTAYCALPITDIIEMRQGMLDMARNELARQQGRDGELSRRVVREALGLREVDPVDIASLDAQPAGTWTPYFLPSFIPIAENQSGDYLIVDARSGPASGCVIESLKDAEIEAPLWPSVAAMLSDISESLHTGRSIGFRRPTIEDDFLDWIVMF